MTASEEYGSVEHAAMQAAFNKRCETNAEAMGTKERRIDWEGQNNQPLHFDKPGVPGPLQQAVTAHYDNMVIDVGDMQVLRLDPYLIAKCCGVTDPVMFHILKTVLRSGDSPKHSIFREFDAISKSALRGIEIFETYGI